MDVSYCLAFSGHVGLLDSSELGLLLTFALASKEALGEPVLDVEEPEVADAAGVFGVDSVGLCLDVAVVSGVFAAFSCSLVFKLGFLYLVFFIFSC